MIRYRVALPDPPAGASRVTLEDGPTAKFLASFLSDDASCELFKAPPSPATTSNQTFARDDQRATYSKETPSSSSPTSPTPHPTVSDGGNESPGWPSDISLSCRAPEDSFNSSLRSTLGRQAAAVGLALAAEVDDTLPRKAPSSPAVLVARDFARSISPRDGASGADLPAAVSCKTSCSPELLAQARGEARRLRSRASPTTHRQPDFGATEELRFNEEQDGDIEASADPLPIPLPQGALQEGVLLHALRRQRGVFGVGRRKVRRVACLLRFDENTHEFVLSYQRKGGGAANDVRIGVNDLNEAVEDSEGTELRLQWAGPSDETALGGEAILKGSSAAQVSLVLAEIEHIRRALVVRREQA